MKHFFITLVILCSSLAFANSYSTTFPAAENPISQSGRWINGGTVGLDWTNMQTVIGQAYGTENCGNGPTDDSTAVLTGGWGPNQSISYIVHYRTGSSSNEIEGRLNTSIAPHSITGYEIDTSIGYVEIVRWNGALGDFTILANPTGSAPGVHEGDTVTATNVNGLITVKINGTTVQTATDTTFKGGSPGIGAFCRGSGGIDSDLSMTSFSASDGVGPYLSSGIIDQSRSIDWSKAGLPATLPDGETTTNPWTPPTGRTQCGSTIAAGASSTTINNALIACTAGHFVLLGSGTFTLASTNINMFAANGGCLSPGNCPAAGLNGGGVTLRGSGPNSTKIVMTGSSVIGFGVSWSAPTCTVSASGLYQYSTSLVVTGCSSPPVAGQMIFLQQCDTGWSGASCSTGSSVDNGAVFICGEDPLCQNPANGLGTHSHQKQTLFVTAVSGSGTLTLTLSTPIYLSNWSTSNTPTITWTGEVPGQNAPAIYGLGLEDLTVDETGTNWAGISANYGIMLNNCYACWMKGVRVLGNGAAGGGFNFNNTKNVLVANNDFFNNPFISTDGLTIVSSGNADSLIVNNILQYGDCEEEDSGNQGMVWAYNYCRDANTNGYFTVLFQHTAGNAFTLYEGNQMGMADLDTIHGYGKNFISYFRNYLPGYDVPYNTASGPFVMEWDAGARFENAVGNIFGSSKITNYSSTSAFVYNIGGGCCADQLAGLSELRWGNCDSATGTCRNQSSEIPSTLNNYSSATLTLSGSGTSWSGTIPSGNRPILFGSEVLIDQTTGQCPNIFGYDPAYNGVIRDSNATTVCPNPPGPIGVPIISSATINNTTGAVSVTFLSTPPVTPKLNYIFSNGAPSPFVNSVPASNTLPCSFFMSGCLLPSWWNVATNWNTFPTSAAATQTQPLPIAGPDVSGGPYSVGTGSAYDVPAALAQKYLPIDTGTCGTVSCQQSFTITSSSWSGGTETLTVSSLPASVHHLMGGFQLSGVNAACIPSGINFSNLYGNNEVLMTSSSATTISYALPNPGLSCTGTLLWPNVRQFDERVYLNGTSGGQPTVSIVPSSLTFASQVLNTQSPTQTVTIQNTATVPVLTIASLQVPAQYFQSGGTCVIPGTLNPGVSCTVLIGFQPTQVGTVTGSLCFNDNAVGSPQCISMSGVGTPTTASFTPNPLAFGPHTVGSTSAPLTATLTNTGAAVLTLNCSGCGIGITNSSIFSFVGTTCGAQLGPGAFCTVSISFSPPSSGAFSGTMTYTTDAANSPNVITMTGSGGTSHWVIGRVGIGAMRWGRNAGLPTPNLYFARTDQCNGSGTGGDTGCTGQAAMNFFGRNTSAGQAYTPIDVPPLLNNGNPLTGQNVCGIDTDFHTKICRVTDYSSMSALGSGFNTGSGGDVQNWAADTSGYIVYTAGGGQPVLMSFTPGTMASSASQIGGIVGTSDCSGAVYFGTNCKSFVTGNISYSPSDGSAIYEMDLGPAPTHIYLNKLTLSKAGAPSTWSFSRSMLFDFGSAGGSTHCLPSDFAASYVGSFNISADSSTFAFAIGDNGQNGQRDYTITGAIASGSFTKGETLTQAVTGAVTVIDTCGALACTSPFAIRAYTGTPDSTHDWVGTGGGHFTPTGLPVLQHYGASFLILYDTGQTGCRVLKTFGPGHDGFGPMVIDGDWGPTGNVLMGTDKQATTCNATNTGQTPNCYPNTVPLGTSAGPTLLDTMELHNAGPTNDKKYIVFSGSDIQACTTVGGRSTCYCASSNLCEAYTWEGATLNIRPNLPEGHNVKGSLGAYKGTNYAFFTYHDPYIKLSNLLTVTIPVDQHGASGNLNSVDAEPVAFAAQQSCGTATGPGNLACDPNYGTITGTPGNYPYYDEFVAVENQGAYCSVNPTIGPICLTPPAQHCNYGAGANTTACAYRFAHCFNSGTNWNFSTQNCIANISPNGDYAMLATDWFPTGSATDGLNRGFGCTNGDDGITPGHLCLPNLDANGKGTAYTTSASKSGSTITFISTDTTVGIMKPTVGAKLTVSGFAGETRYNATWTVATSPGGGVWTASSTATAFAADSGGKANWDCGNGALASTPCPRGDIVVINLRTAGTVH